MASYPNRFTGGRLISMLFLAWFAAAAMAGGVLASMMRVDVSAFYTTGNVVYTMGEGSVSRSGSGSGSDHADDRATEEPRASARVKIQIRPWASDRIYGKVAGAVSVGTASGVRWHVRARTPGQTHSWPASERLLPSRDCV